MTRLLSIAGFSFLFLATVSTAGFAQATLDPQAIVGEWNGSWVDRREAQQNGQYSLTIDRVEGNTVYGHGTLMIRRSFDFKFIGTLDGNRLTFGTETKVTLTIDGSHMRGTSEGPTAARNITLSKHK